MLHSATKCKTIKTVNLIFISWYWVRRLPHLRYLRLQKGQRKFLSYIQGGKILFYIHTCPKQCGGWGGRARNLQWPTWLPAARRRERGASKFCPTFAPEFFFTQHSHQNLLYLAFAPGNVDPIFTPEIFYPMLALKTFIQHLPLNKFTQRPPLNFLLNIAMSLTPPNVSRKKNLLYHAPEKFAWHFFLKKKIYASLDALGQKTMISLLQTQNNKGRFSNKCCRTWWWQWLLP